MLVGGGHGNRFPDPGAPRKYSRCRCRCLHPFAHRSHYGLRRFTALFSCAWLDAGLRVGRDDARSETCISVCVYNPNPFPGYLKPEPHEIDGPFELGATVITPLPVPHGNSIVNGYLFSRSGEKLVAYLSDCSGVPNAIVDLIADVKVLIIDALRDKPHPTHLSVDQALEVAARVRPKATYFTHIAHELPQSAESRLPAGAHIAYDGLKLGL